MAKIMIENAEVTRVLKSGTGFHAQTQYSKRDGETVTEKWVIWTNEPVTLGEVVTVEGLFSKKNETFTNDKGEEIKYTAIHVNNPDIRRSPQPTPNNDEWLNKNTQPVLDNQVPF